MASRALMARFRMAFSSCEASIMARHNPARWTTSISMFSSRVRLSRGSKLLTRRLMSVTPGSSGWRRAKASSLLVNSAPRIAAVWEISASSRSCGLDPSSVTSNSELPRMTVNRLLKSCAIPPVSFPIESSLWACCSCSSISLRSLMSIREPIARIALPDSSLMIWPRSST